MIDYDRAQVRRQVDPSSPTRMRLIDVVRTKLLLSRTGIVYGKNVCVKAGVKVSIPDTGSLSIGANCLFHQGVKLLLTMPQPVVHIGKWVFVGMDTIIAAKKEVRIGDFTFFAPRCYVIDHDHGFLPDQLIHNQKSVLKAVEIGRDCYFGTGSVVLGGSVIGDGAIVGAASVVRADIGPGEIWAGNPAKKVGLREKYA